MSDTHAQSSTFVRTQMLSEAEPPLREKGAVKWLRENLFSSWLNAILTILSLLIVYWALSGLIPWLANSVWTAGSLTECRQVLSVDGLGSHDGACFAVITDRWVQLIFGFYPSDLYWRPVLAFALFFVALAPVLFSAQLPRQMMWFSLVYPFLAVWLIWGGSIWSPLLVLLGFVVGYLALRELSKIGGAIAGVISAIVVAVIWWGLITPWATNTLHRVVGEARIESETAALSAMVDEMTPRLEALEAERDGLIARVNEEVATKDALLEEALAQRLNNPGTPAFETARSALLAQMDVLMAARREASELAVETFLLDEDLSEARGLLTRTRLLEAQNAQLPGLTEKAAELRANLPDAVANLLSLDGAGDATPEERQALEETLAAEEQAATLRDALESTYATLGRVGLEPVQSREIGGFTLGMIIGVSGIVLSLPLGILLALGRQSPLLIINKSSVAFIEVIRGVPLIVWLITASLLLNYFLPPGTNFDLMLRVIIMVTLFSAAYIAEVIRGGLAALPKGQYEGADSLGLDYWQSMRLIILPQALKISIPGIVNTFIGLFKDTVLVVFIGLLDPIGLTNAIRASTDWNGIYWELFIFIGLLFFIFCYSMGRYSLYLEKKLQRENR